MLYISLSAVFIKKVNNFNKTWLKDIEYTYGKYLLLFTTKSKQIPELSQKRGSNGSTRVIAYADSKYDVVNNIW